MVRKTLVVLQVGDVRRTVTAGNGQFCLGQLRPAAQVLEEVPKRTQPRRCASGDLRVRHGGLQALALALGISECLGSIVRR